MLKGFVESICYLDVEIRMCILFFPSRLDYRAMPLCTTDTNVGTRTSTQKKTRIFFTLK